MMTRSGHGLKALHAASSPEAESIKDFPRGSQKFLKPLTRQNTAVWLIGKTSSSITGSKLPTNRQVLEYYYLLCNDPQNERLKVRKETLAYNVVDTVSVFWNMARIKTKKRQYCMKDVLRLFGEFASLEKSKGRKNDVGGKRCLFLTKLFDITASDAEEEIMKSRFLSEDKKQEDIDFYRDQKGEMKATMSGHDKLFQEKVEMQQVRENNFEILQFKERERTTIMANFDSQPGSIASTETESYSDVGPCTSRLRKRREDLVAIYLQKKFMTCEAITSSADRLKLSDNQTTGIISAVIKASEGNLDDFDISRQTTRRNISKNRKMVADMVLEQFKADPPQFCALHSV